MNRVLKKTGMMMAMAAIISLGASCSDDNNENQSGDNTLSVNEQKMEAIANQYVTNTIYQTYGAIADAINQLYENLAAVTEKFKTDPQSVSQSDIDTWPLDADGLATALKNADQVAKLEGEEGIAYAGGKLGQELLGFHGIEFIIFRDGANRKIADLRAEETNEAFTKIGAHVTGLQELIYATAVAGDLRDRCFQMEVAWNAGAPQSHIDRVEEVELPFTVNGGSKSYGENMLAAGKAGSTYASWQEVMVTILQAGCENIANEVANTKIGNPYSGEDVNYIESPYSHKSFIDFRDNILSIENSLYGGRKADGRDTSKSIIQYMKDNSYPSLASLETAVAEAIATLETCQSTLGSFVQNVNNPLVGEAQKKVQILDDELVKAAGWFATQK